MRSYAPGLVVTYIGNYSAWEICLFSPIYLFNHPFLSVWTHGYLFYTLGYNPMTFCSSCSSFGHWELSLLAPVSLCYTSIIVFLLDLISGLFVCFLVSSYVLVLEDAPGSPCVSPVPLLESAISPRSTSSVYWRMVSETKI